MTELTITERVANGAAWLDENKPGWERIIELADLKLENTCQCVLGQLFQEEAGIVSYKGAWAYGKYQYRGYDFVVQSDDSWEQDGLGKNTNWAVEHGFDSMHNLPGKYKTHEREYEKLQEAWVELVKNRFDTGALSDG